MDAKVFRMALLTILSAFILVLVIVYATNADKINDMFGWGKEKETVSEEASEEESIEVIYGEQIGDSLSGFLLDADFFDETEKVPSVVVIKKTQSSSGASTTESSVSEEEEDGTGMAVVGQLTNPNPPEAEASVDSSGYLTSLPTPPPGGYGEFIPSDQTVTGTPVGTTP